MSMLDVVNRTASGERVQSFHHGPHLGGAHHPRDFGAIAQKDESGPQLDLERAAERPAGAVLYFQTTHFRMSLECLTDQRLGSLAVAAPVGAGFEDRCARKHVNLGTG